MPRVSDSYREGRRDQIVDAARRCFVRSGFDGTSMQDLFAESRLSSGAFYRYFPSKEALVVAIAEDNMRDVVDMIHALASGRDTSSLGTLLGAAIDVVRARHATDGLGGLAVQVWAEALTNDAVRRQFASLLEQLRSDLRDLASELQAVHALPHECSPEAVATVLLATIPGCVLQLAILGPQSLNAVPEAMQILWPQQLAGDGRTQVRAAME